MSKYRSSGANGYFTGTAAPDVKASPVS